MAPHFYNIIERKHFYTEYQHFPKKSCSDVKAVNKRAMKSSLTGVPGVPDFPDGPDSPGEPWVEIFMSL